jgi:outer membrane cobalamin receptor
MGAVSAVYADQAGAPGGFSSLYLRGADPNHTVIMIDGVKISDPTNSRGGGIDLSSIDPRSIARIEILPGASSAIYGSDAMAGAVNIITRAPGATGLQLSAGAGGDGYRRAAASGAIRSGALALGAQAAAIEDGRPNGESFLRLRTQSLRFSAGDADRNVTAWLRAQQREGRAFPDDSGGPRLAANRELEHRDEDGVAASLSGEVRAPWGALRVYSNLYQQHAKTASPGVAPGLRDPAGLPRTLSDADYVRSTVGAMVVLERDPDASAVVGGQWERERGDVASTFFFGPAAVLADFALERQTYSVFAVGRTALTERLSAHVGVRSDRTDSYGSPVTVRSGLQYRAGGAVPALALSYGTGFKSPSFFALGNPLVGNPQLQAEKSRTLELSAFSADAKPVETRYRYRASVFRSTYEHLIDFESGPPPRLVNRGEVTIEGYDASVGARLDERSNVQLQLTGLVFDLPRGTPPLRNRPRFRATAAASRNLTADTTASLYATWTGRAYDSSVPTGLVQLSPYFLMSASIVSSLRGVRLTLAVDNLLDRKYEQFVGFPARGRRARVEVGLDI